MISTSHKQETELNKANRHKLTFTTEESSVNWHHGYKLVLIISIRLFVNKPSVPGCF